MFFLNPTYLLGFLGLAVPIAIHLWSKKEGRKVQVGSIKFLEEADSNQGRSLKLNEYWLLVLRMLIISLLVLILAEPRLKQEVQKRPVMVVVEPSLLSSDRVNSIIDTIDSGRSVRLLQSGFPELDRDDSHSGFSEVPNYWQLAKEMENLPADTVVVFSNAFKKGFKGMRPRVNKNIKWIILDPGSEVKELVQARKINEEVELLYVLSDSQRLDYEKERVSINSSEIEINSRGDSLRILKDENLEWLPLVEMKPVEVLLVYGDSLKSESKYLEFSFRAIAKYRERPIEVIATQDVDSLEEESFDLLVWLRDQEALETRGPVLVYKPDSLSSELIVEGTSDNIFELTRPLDIENIVEGHLPERLLMLLDLNPALEDSMQAYDGRVMAREQMLTRHSLVEDTKPYFKIINFQLPLWLSFLGALAVERILSFYRRQ